MSDRSSDHVQREHSDAANDMTAQDESGESVLPPDIGLPDLLGDAGEESDALFKLDAPPVPASVFVAPRDEAEQTMAKIWQQVLGVERVGIHDNFFELGGDSLLLMQVAAMAEQAGFQFTPYLLLECQTIAELSETEALICVEGERAMILSEQLTAASPNDRQGIVEGYLRQKIAHSISANRVEQTSAEGDLAEFDLRLLSAELVGNLRQDMGLQFMPYEIARCSTISGLARFLLAEFGRTSDLATSVADMPLSTYSPRDPKEFLPRRSSVSTSVIKNKGTVFLLSSPRAGSTLLRVMLAGHPDLFCPPELFLLLFDDMRGWQIDSKSTSGVFWHKEGVHQAFTQLMGLQTEEGWDLLDDLVAKNSSIHSVYGMLQDLIGDRLLLDKTPIYAVDVDILRRAEVMFEAPKYIHLVRHPYSVIDSMLRMRFDRQYCYIFFGREDVDPYVVNEVTWAVCNQNVLEFLEQVEPERQQLIRFEDLVSEPERIMVELCQFLAVPFDEAVLNPYDGDHDRIISGLGDPNILRHSQISSQRGDAWKRINLPRHLDVSTVELASHFGYEMPQEQGRRGKSV